MNWNLEFRGEPILDRLVQMRDEMEEMEDELVDSDQNYSLSQIIDLMDALISDMEDGDE